MFCSNCGTKLVDGALFCSNCGTRVAAPAAPVVTPVVETPVVETPVVQTPVTPVVETPVVETPVVQTPVTPVVETPVVETPIVQTPVTPVVETPVVETPTYIPPQQQIPVTPVVEAPTYTPPQQQAPVYTPPQQGGYTPYQPSVEPTPAPKKKAPIGVIVAAILIVLAIGVVIAGFMTDWFGLAGPMTQIAKATAKTLDAENFTVTVDTSDFEVTAQISLNLKDRELTVVGTGESEEESFYIYDGYMIVGYDGYYYAEDISDTLDTIFDAYEDAAEDDFSSEKIIELLDDMGALESFDEEELEKSINTLFKKLNTKSWLKKNAGYSKGKQKGATAHIFEPNLQKLLTAVLEILEPAFDDKDLYDGFVEKTEDIDEDELPYIKASILVKSGKLTGIIIDIGEDDYCDITFKNIGKTDIDYDMLDEILDEAEY